MQQFCSLLTFNILDEGQWGYRVTGFHYWPHLPQRAANFRESFNLEKVSIVLFSTTSTPFRIMNKTINWQFPPSSSRFKIKKMMTSHFSSFFTPSLAEFLYFIQNNVFHFHTVSELTGRSPVTSCIFWRIEYRWNIEYQSTWERLVTSISQKSPIWWMIFPYLSYLPISNVLLHNTNVAFIMYNV